MEGDSTALWADIKKYEDTLAKDPGSYCFAPLAELYRKLGLLDEAIQVAKRGCDIHPDYVGGYMALGRAFLEKGMKDEGRGALEKVVGITPDNLLAQRLLSQIYAEQGDTAAAARTLRLILAQSPGDEESQALLDSLGGSMPAGAAMGTITREDERGEDVFFPDAGTNGLDTLPEDDIDFEDAEIIEELTDEDLLEEEFVEGDFIVSPAKADVPVGYGGHSEGKNPLSTVTLAELYISQGFLKRALTIYRELHESDPDNADLTKRLFELKKAIDEDAASARDSVLAGDELTPEAAGTSGYDDPAATEERVIEALEKWLVAIGRRR